MRTSLALLVGAFFLWLSIWVFGWIVSGDIADVGVRIRRDDTPVKFWAGIVFFSAVACAGLGLAMAILFRMV
ncbi:MAG TPA: hypothetical protein VEK08_05715 [Planctomycetota bacterium]|nr:hypothetical protein [Planctomycetota bacterium]